VTEILDEPSVVVTGAGSGIGRAVALMMSERGTHVLCVGRRAHLIDETVTICGDHAVGVIADVSTDDGIATILTALAARPLKSLIHCAAIEGVHSLDNTDRETFDELIAINLGGPFHLTKALAPHFALDGSIVFVASVSANSGRSHHAAYSASKAGLLGLAKSLAVELAPQVRVNCVAPGAVQTPMLDQAITDFLTGLDDDQIRRALDAEGGRILLEKVAQPREIAQAIVYLALDDSYCTGTVLTIDGGYSAH
jgi:NAD(P)-dependent dehydrogenase (short-subunit alcohol dehydrogenase family)